MPAPAPEVRKVPAGRRNAGFQTQHARCAALGWAAQRACLFCVEPPHTNSGRPAKAPKRSFAFFSQQDGAALTKHRRSGAARPIRPVFPCCGWRSISAPVPRWAPPPARQPRGPSAAHCPACASPQTACPWTGALVFTGRRRCSPPCTFTVPVSTRVGCKSSLFAIFRPARAARLPVTAQPFSSSTFRWQPLGHTMQIKLFHFASCHLLPHDTVSAPIPNLRQQRLRAARSAPSHPGPCARAG